MVDGAEGSDSNGFEQYLKDVSASEEDTLTISDDGIGIEPETKFGGSSGSAATFMDAVQRTVQAGLPSTQVAATQNPEVDQVLFHAQLLAQRTCGRPDSMKQPWEKGPMAVILGGLTASSFLGSNWLQRTVALPPVIVASKAPVDTVAAGLKLAPTKRPFVSSAVLKIKRSVAPEFTGNPNRFRALARWRIIVELDLHSSLLGRQLVDYVIDGRAESVIMQILEDSFAKKSTSTLMKRSSALLKYILFTRAHFKAKGLSYNEQWIYDFLCSMRVEMAAASAAKSLIEALTFAIHLIGPDVEDPLWKSARVLGATQAMFVLKKPLHQTDPLLVVEVLLLHHILQRADGLHHKVLAGYMLFCIYACARWSDCMKPKSFQYDIVSGEGYFEIKTLNHKMASSADRKTVLMPCVATCPGLGPSNPAWVDLWLEARKQSGLEFVSMPTMPGISTSGDWTADAMTASEGTANLRDMLESYGTPLVPGRKVASHSLKSTGLSWASKKPLKKSFRKALGHHIDSADTSVATYSRDFLFAPLLAFDQMIHEIKSGEFTPDDSRAARALGLKRRRVEVETPFPPVPPGLLVSQQVEPSSAEAASSSSSDSSDSSSEESLPPPAEEEAAATLLGVEKPLESRKLFTDERGASLEVFQHCTSGVLHARASSDRLMCGRLISRHFAKIKDDLKLKWPKCELCDKKCANPKFVQPVSKASSAIPPSLVVRQSSQQDD